MWTPAQSDLQMLQIGNAGLHERQSHFDEVIADAAGFGSGEDAFPVESSLPYGDYRFCLRVPALDVHGDEAAGVLHEVIGGIETIGDGGDLELKFDGQGIEELKEQVVSALAVDTGEFEVFVVKALNDAGLGGAVADAVVLVGGALHVVHGGVLRAAETGHQHLSEAEILCPGDASGLVLAQLVHGKMAADAGEAGVVDDAAKLSAGIFLETAEAGVVVADGRAHLDRPEARGRELAEGAGEVLRDGLADGPRLTGDGETERIGQ